MNVEVKYYIYELRNRKNISLRKLEELSGVSRSTINNIENGKYDPSVKTLCLIAGALKIRPESLFSYTFFKDV